MYSSYANQLQQQQYRLQQQQQLGAASQYSPAQFNLAAASANTYSKNNNNRNNNNYNDYDYYDYYDYGNSNRNKQQQMLMNQARSLRTKFDFKSQIIIQKIIQKINSYSQNQNHFFLVF